MSFPGPGLVATVHVDMLKYNLTESKYRTQSKQKMDKKKKMCSDIRLIQSIYAMHEQKQIKRDVSG